jgi:electron transfer flavoprotein alpha subunit
MKTAVCMKYVPVIARMQFDYEARTIVRDGVPSEVNAFDQLGLVRAVELKSVPDDEVVVLTMGPPTAAEGLTTCLALGADRGVLISDRALAGSDTLATSRALALALAREAPDLIICGRNSTDGETGQVGPEVAELMGLPHVSHVRRLNLSDDRLTAVVERITDEGFQTLECDLPAVICVTEGIAPELFPNREQMEQAATKPVDEVNCAMLSDDTSQFGSQGSPTWVNEIRLVEPNRLGVTLQEVTPEDAAQQIADSVRERLAELAAAEPEMSGEPLPRYPGQAERSIWVVAENSRDGLAHVTYEMLGKARDLTAITRSEVIAVVIAREGEAYSQSLAAAGADRVLLIDNSSLGPVCGRAVGNVLAAAVERETPYAILFAATADGRDLAARLAAKLSLGLTGDAIDLEIDDDGQLVQLKPALGGNVVAPILSKTLPNLVTLRPGLLTPAVEDPGATATVEHLAAAPFEGADVRLVREEFQEDTEGLDLARARIVVGIGMGAGEENVTGLQDLARSISASVATTRDVVHAGWLPQQLQVGVSGRTIAPTVYIAVGIRGAFNHTVGLQRAGIIVAVNQNRRATIFRSADFGVIGTWQEFLPPLIEALRPVLADLPSS